ncbi:hypothetical protein OTERR_14230 [Oryzomicrobium terrae]|uniref:HDOD domain-containing protein n=1 Tax=Oryzomicrobium terrae TaxID=1735038 RepID=A0A5C1E8F1_9RHOO|nr:HDOD domain-containing protein [Oryzomicrobium terrae]QEL64899.1 hypothetical protein OTERR_14230 [Oryzomicrobium terrae]
MTLSPLTLPELEGSLGRLPSMPAVVTELLLRLEDPDLDTRQLAHDIARDQSLAAKTLRIANSPFYGLRGRVASIQDAVTILGLHTVRTLMLAAAAGETLGRLKAEGLDTTTYWRHCTATAILARILAVRARANPESAFVVGLLHDIGRLVIATNFPTHYRAVHERSKAESLSLLEAERLCLGIDHVQVGELLARRWVFPLTIVEGIAGHHAPEKWGHQPLAAVASLADSGAHELGKNLPGAWTPPPRSDYAWAALNLDDAAWAAILAEAGPAAEEFSQVFVA